MTDAEPTLSSLTVLGGPLDGTRYVLSDAVEEILIGSDSGCQFCLELPGVTPIHAKVWVDVEGAKVYDTRSPRGVYVNDDPVSGEGPLRDGDVLWLGPPGDEASVMVQFRFRPPGAPGFVMPEEAVDVVEEPVIEPAPEPVVDVFVVEPSAEPAAAAPDVGEFVVEPTPTPAPEEVMLFEEANPPAPAAPEPEPMPVPEVPAPEPEPLAAPAEEVLLFEEPAAPPAVAVPPPPPAPPPPAAKPAAAPAPPAEAKPAPAPPAAAPAAPTPRPRPAPAPPAPAPKAAAPPRPAAKPSAPVGRYAAIGVVALAVLGGGGYLAWHAMTKPQLASVAPARARVGETVTLTGKYFGGGAGENAVLFGEKPGRVVQASATQLRVEVPELATAAGRDTPVPVRVRTGGRDSNTASLGLYQAPRVHGVSPEVAMPGEEVVLAGTGWATGATVSFGAMAAEVLETTPTSIRVRVPALEAGPGTAVPVTVSTGKDPSNPAPFVIGRLPLVTGIEPGSAAQGDVVVINGRGFQPSAAADDVRVGGTRALVLASEAAELKVVVPWVPGEGGAVAVEVRVPGSETVGRGTLTLPASADPIELRFAPMLLADYPGGEQVAVGTALGPAFVLAASGGARAADRALAAAKRLNEAAVLVKASRDADFVARGFESSPVIALVGKNEPVLEVTAEDAAVYEEARVGKGGPVTRARLAVWWGAVARDLVLLLVRSEKPQHVAAVASAEGRVLAEVFQAARKTAQFGVPQRVAGEAKPAMHAALMNLARRVPASVPTPAGAPAAAAEAGLPPLELDRTWQGYEEEGGIRKYIQVTFRGAGGTFGYEGGVTLSMPLDSVSRQKGSVRFSMRLRGGIRHYVGRWDGVKIAGTISLQPDGKGSLGSFELNPR